MNRNRICAPVRAIVILLCVGLLFGTGCRRESAETIPANWPEYAMSGIRFRLEPGWSAVEPEDWEETLGKALSDASLGYDAADDFQWIGMLASPDLSTKTRDYLVAAYISFPGEITETVLQEQLEQMKDLKLQFVQAGTTASMLSDPQMREWGGRSVIAFTIRMNLSDDTRTVIQVGLVPHGTRLYVFHYVDEGAEQSNGNLRKVFESLNWI